MRDMIYIYKIATMAEWSAASKTGSFNGSSDDRRDGYIHFSTRDQLQHTLEKHFKGKRDLVLIAFEASKLGSALKWEQSRGGELFPHLYANVSVSDASWQRPLREDATGVPRIDEEWLAC